MGTVGNPSKKCCPWWPFPWGLVCGIATVIGLLIAMSIAVYMLYKSHCRRQEEMGGAGVFHTLSQASEFVGLSRGYLERACDNNGRFIYRVNVVTDKSSREYNIVRHSGGIYALAMCDPDYSDPVLERTMVRASGFLLHNYVARPETAKTSSELLAVWDTLAAKAGDRESSLGANGLALVALASVEKRIPGTCAVASLEGIGNFILYLQKPDGSFYCKYSTRAGRLDNWESLYYPGEAALGLICLYELDHNRKWLFGSAKALEFLVRSRLRVAKWPPDQWALIATAELMPHLAQCEAIVSRDSLVEHAMRISDVIMSEQVYESKNAAIIGSFDPFGRTTPAAVRIEGLVSAFGFVRDSKMRIRIMNAAQRGVGFLDRMQIKNGKYAGGMPGAWSESEGLDVAPSRKDQSEVRIDYVQHALCAVLLYKKKMLSNE